MLNFKRFRQDEQDLLDYGQGNEQNNLKNPVKLCQSCLKSKF